MSYIPLPSILAALSEHLRHALKDSDPYVRKTAAICVAKVFVVEPRMVERERFIDFLKELLKDVNPTVVSNAVAALTEIADRSDSITLKFPFSLATKLVAALENCSECVAPFTSMRVLTRWKMGADIHLGLVTELCASDFGRSDHHDGTDSCSTAAFQFGSRVDGHQGSALLNELYRQQAEQRLSVQEDGSTVGCVDTQPGSCCLLMNGSDTFIFRTRSSIRCIAKYPTDHPATTFNSQG